nr:hypothetical protein NZ312_16170 [Clostridioides difficile]
MIFIHIYVLKNKVEGTTITSADIIINLVSATTRQMNKRMDSYMWI